MGDRQHAGVLQRNAEVEDVRMRVERIRRRIDHLVADRRRVHAGLEVDAAAEQPRRVQLHVRLQQRRLVAHVGGAVEHADIVQVARVGAVQPLQREADVIGQLRIGRPLHRHQGLVELEVVRLVGEQLAEVLAVAGSRGVEDDAALQLQVDLDPGGPGIDRKLRRRGLRRRRGLGGRRGLRQRTGGDQRGGRERGQPFAGATGYRAWGIVSHGHWVLLRHCGLCPSRGYRNVYTTTWRAAARRPARQPDARAASPGGSARRANGGRRWHPPPARSRQKICSPCSTRSRPSRSSSAFTRSPTRALVM